MKYTIVDNDIICLECYDEDTYLEEGDSQENYSINDCVLVRTTHAFPFNHEIVAPYYDGLYDFGIPYYFEFNLSDILKEKYPSTWEEEIKKYYTYYENLRKTVHFTINGLVQSTMYGNFSSRPFIIIEPLKYHISNPPLSLRAEDTFFKEKIELSKDCVLLIKFEEYEKIKNDPRYIIQLNQYKILVYKGNNEVQALHQTLQLLGYDSFKMSDHGYTSGSRDKSSAKKMTLLLSDIAEKNGIPQRKHCYTDEYKEEKQNMFERNTELDEMFLNYILENANISQELKSTVLDIIPHYSYYAHSDIIKKMIEKIGLEKLAELTHNFNEMLIKENKEKTKRRR